MLALRALGVDGAARTATRWPIAGLRGRHRRLRRAGSCSPPAPPRRVAGAVRRPWPPRAACGWPRRCPSTCTSCPSTRHVPAAFAAVALPLVVARPAAARPRAGLGGLGRRLRPAGRDRPFRRAAPARARHRVDCATRWRRGAATRRRSRRWRAAARPLPPRRSCWARCRRWPPSAILHGSPLRSGRLTRFFWSEPHLWETGVLDPARRSSCGRRCCWPRPRACVLLLRRDRARRAAPLLCASFGATTTWSPRYELWHGSSSFGNRFFVPLTPVFVLGPGRAAGRRAATRCAGWRRRGCAGPCAGAAGPARGLERGPHVPVGHRDGPAPGSGRSGGGGAQPGGGRAAPDRVLRAALPARPGNRPPESRPPPSDASARCAVRGARRPPIPRPRP